MSELPGGWRREEDALVRDLEFPNFTSAMAYVNAVAEVAEEVNHHPDITVHGWNKVRLVLSTHSTGGLTDADYGMARRIESISTE